MITDEKEVTVEEEGVHIQLYNNLAPELDLRVHSDLILVVDASLRLKVVDHTQQDSLNAVDAEYHPLGHHMVSHVFQVLCVTSSGDNQAHTIHLEGEKVEAAPEHAPGEGVKRPLELVILLRLRQYDH